MRANYRVVKTVSNGNWNNGNAFALTMGLNTITVSAVTFDRTVKLQFSDGTIEFDLLEINGDVSLPWGHGYWDAGGAMQSVCRWTQ